MAASTNQKKLNPKRRGAKTLQNKTKQNKTKQNCWPDIFALLIRDLRLMI